MKVDFKLSGIDGVLEMLQKLPAETVSKNGGPVKRSLLKGGRILSKQAALNLQKSIDAAGKTGITVSTGFTAKNVIAKRGRPPKGVKGERVVITMKNPKHPGGNLYQRKSRGSGRQKNRKGPTGKPIQANDLAFMFEYGTSKMVALPWLRPAYLSKREQVVKTVEVELSKDVLRIAKRLAKKGR